MRTSVVFTTVTSILKTTDCDLEEVTETVTILGVMTGSQCLWKQLTVVKSLVNVGFDDGHFLNYDGEETPVYN